MRVTKLLIFPVEIRIFCPKTTKFGPKLAFLVNLGQAMQAYSMPCCGSVGGCGARAVSRKTPIYFIYICHREETSFSPSFTAAFWQTVKSARIRFYPTFLQDLSEGLWQHISGISPPLHRGFSLFVNIPMDICQRSRYEDKYVAQPGALIALVISQ